MWNQWAAGPAPIPPMPVQSVIPQQPPLPTAPPPLPTTAPIPATPGVGDNTAPPSEGTLIGPVLPTSTPGMQVIGGAPQTGQYTAAQYAAMTPEQQAALAAHWQQWQEYQTEYAKWHAQYGEQYKREMAAAAAVNPTPSHSSYYSTQQPQPPLPPDNTQSQPAKIAGQPQMYAQPQMQFNQPPPATPAAPAMQNYQQSWQTQHNYSQMPTNLNQPPPNFNQQQLGYNQPPSNYSQRPPNFGQQPSNFGQQPPTYGQKPSNFNTQPPNYSTQPPNFNSMQQNTNTQSPSFNQQNTQRFSNQNSSNIEKPSSFPLTSPQSNNNRLDFKNDFESNISNTEESNNREIIAPLNEESCNTNENSEPPLMQGDSNECANDDSLDKSSNNSFRPNNPDDNSKWNNVQNDFNQSEAKNMEINQFNARNSDRGFGNQDNFPRDSQDLDRWSNNRTSQERNSWNLGNQRSSLDNSTSNNSNNNNNNLRNNDSNSNYNRFESQNEDTNRFGNNKSFNDRGSRWGGNQNNESRWGDNQSNENRRSGNQSNENRWGGGNQNNENRWGSNQNNENRWGSNQNNDNRWSSNQNNENRWGSSGNNSGQFNQNYGNNSSNFRDTDRNNFDSNDRFNANRNQNFDNFGQNQMQRNWNNNSNSNSNYYTQSQQQQMKQQQQLRTMELDEAAFDKLFSEWEQRFEDWKRLNVNHPDPALHRRYLQDFENQRQRFVERRNQMRKRKMLILGVNPDSNEQINKQETDNNKIQNEVIPNATVSQENIRNATVSQEVNVEHTPKEIENLPNSGNRVDTKDISIQNLQVAQSVPVIPSLANVEAPVAQPIQKVVLEERKEQEEHKAESVTPKEIFDTPNIETQPEKLIIEKDIVLTEAKKTPLCGKRKSRFNDSPPPEKVNIIEQEPVIENKPAENNSKMQLVTEIITLDDDENEEHNEDPIEPLPIRNIFKKSDGIPGLDLVEDNNLKQTDALETKSENTESIEKVEKLVEDNSTSSTKKIPSLFDVVIEKPNESTFEASAPQMKPDEIKTTTEQLPNLVEQLQNNLLQSLPDLTKALSDPNIMQMLNQNIMQNSNKNSQVETSQLLLQQLPALLQQLQPQLQQQMPNNSGMQNLQFSDWQQQNQNPVFNNNMSAFPNNPNNFNNNNFEGNRPFYNEDRGRNFNNNTDNNRSNSSGRQNNFGDNGPFFNNRGGNDLNFNNRGNNSFGGNDRNFNNRGNNNFDSNFNNRGNSSFGGNDSSFNNKRNFGGNDRNYNNRGNDFGDNRGSNFRDNESNFRERGNNFNDRNRQNFDNSRSSGGNDRSSIGSNDNVSKSFIQDKASTSEGGPNNESNNEKKVQNVNNPFRRSGGPNNSLFDGNDKNTTSDRNRSSSNERKDIQSPWNIGQSDGSQYDEFYRPAQIIDYHNNSITPKVFDYGHKPSGGMTTELNTTHDGDFRPLKTIDYGHSSNVTNNSFGSSSFQQQNSKMSANAKKRNRRRRNKANAAAKQNSNQTESTQQQLNNADNPNDEKEVYENNEQTDNISGADKDVTIQNDNEKSEELKDNTNESNTQNETLEQISDSEDNLLNYERPDSPIPPPPPIISFNIPNIVGANNSAVTTRMPLASSDINTFHSTNFQISIPTAENNNTISIDDILLPPGRETRPRKIVIILRGPPGSGKSHVAKLIKEKETEMRGASPRILSIDDYFLIENDYEEKCPKTGKKIPKTEILYEYDPDMEESYMQYLIKAFKKTVADNLYDFIIVDCNNNSLRTLNEFYCYAKDSGFVPYIIDLICDVEKCLEQNTHERSEIDIRDIILNWKDTPVHYIKLDVSSLLENVVEMEDAENMVTDNSPLVENADSVDIEPSQTNEDEDDSNEGVESIEACLQY
ncbi:putative uncharacterized protein DDB_G0282133 isoform X2 [Teleopsis dalmanni]|uniref:putative uncharacterized protein DDB_G0282133 isoform X2 n=1 Tax=Teleopsis dalmanni TaxID=139649 RepID=UPI0018CED2FA|nr:putative uncharacterized protein DDB_G0282133 isoform X2 [Teleopsis dalmanni]